MITEPTFTAFLPANVRYDSTLAPYEKLLYAEITAWVNRYGKANLLTSELCERFGSGEHVVDCWLNSLEGKGYIKRSIFRNLKGEVEEQILELIK